MGKVFLHDSLPRAEAIFVGTPFVIRMGKCSKHVEYIHAIFFIELVVLRVKHSYQ
jgi:hypothetical protein